MSPVPTWTNVNGQQQRPSWQSGPPKSNDAPPLDFLSKKPLSWHHPDFGDTSSSKLLPLPPPPPWPGTRAPLDHNIYPYHEPVLPPLHLHHSHHPVTGGHLSTFFSGSAPYQHAHGSRSLPALNDAVNHHFTDAPAQYRERREHHLDGGAEQSIAGRVVHSASEGENLERNLDGRSDRETVDGVIRVAYREGHTMPMSHRVEDVPHRHNAEFAHKTDGDYVQTMRPRNEYWGIPHPSASGSLPDLSPPAAAVQQVDAASSHQPEKRLVRQRSSDTFSMPPAQKRAKTSKESESPVERSSTSPECQAVTTPATSITTSSGKPKPPRKFKCTTPGCDKSFTSSGHLLRHQRTHTGARPYACPLPECGARFSRHDNMQQHYRSHIHKLLESQEVKLTLVNPRSNLGRSGIPITYDELTSGRGELFNAPSLSSLPALPRPTQPLDLHSQIACINSAAEYRDATHFASSPRSARPEYGHDRFRFHQPAYPSDMHITTSAPPQLPSPAEMSHLHSYKRHNHFSLSPPEWTYEGQFRGSSSFTSYPTSIAGYNGPPEEQPLPSIYDPNGPRR
ncbi:hypothetical protein BJ742DRAFT_865712 [Cladochytrium replicatum]|nr:hypothetical protein BJ742DRAFT_865712 [Cladochytrium replicatum]